MAKTNEFSLVYFSFAFHCFSILIYIRQVLQWIENFRSLRQELIAEILNKDSSKKPWLEGVFPVETEMRRPFYWEVTFYQYDFPIKSHCRHLIRVN